MFECFKVSEEIVDGGGVAYTAYFRYWPYTGAYRFTDWPVSKTCTPMSIKCINRPVFKVGDHICMG